MSFLGFYSDGVFDGTGRPIKNATFAVYELDGTTTVACYSDAAGTSAITPASSNLGNLSFYARSGPALLQTGTNPQVLIEVSQPAPTVRTVSVNTAAVYNETVGVDAAGGARTVTLPTPRAGGELIQVKKIDSSTNPVNVIGMIDGATNYALVAQNDAVSVIPNAVLNGFWIT